MPAPIPTSPKSSKPAKDPGTSPWRVLVGAALLGGICLVGWSALITRYQPPTGGVSRIVFTGPWGDAFAPITGLFSALTLGLAFWTLKEQRVELAEQRLEIARQGDLINRQLTALDASRAALDEQAHTLERQRAEMSRHVEVAHAANVLAVTRMHVDIGVAELHADVSVAAMNTAPELGAVVQPLTRMGVTAKSKALSAMVEAAAHAAGVSPGEPNGPHARPSVASTTAAS